MPEISFEQAATCLYSSRETPESEDILSKHNLLIMICKQIMWGMKDLTILEKKHDICVLYKIDKATGVRYNKSD